MHASAYLVGLVATVTLPLIGCGDPAPAVTPAVPSPVEQEEHPAEGDCEPETEEACDCPDGTESLKYCFEDGWGPCSCSEEKPPIEGGLAGDCKPGRYEGEFFGMYNSAFSPFPIPVWAFNVSGKPGLAFTLNASGEVAQAGDEFGGELEISDGYVKGTADGLFPFEGKLTGKLNCKTKEFTATLDGGYALLLEGVLGGLNEAKFKGPVLGHYDVASKSFPCQVSNPKFPKCELDAPVLASAAVTDIVAGTPFPKADNPSHWELMETDISLPIFPSSIPQGHGGMGYWWAVWVGDGTVDPNTGKPKP